jgi:type IV fimbrial biogenesis protein FimT
MRARRPQAGFTVTELMVVVAIVGLIAAIAAPDMVEMIRRQRVKTAAFDIFAGLTMARSEAIKRNAAVTVVPNGGDWARGFVVNDNAARPLRTQSGWDNLTGVGPGMVTFNGTGRLAGGGAVQISLQALDVAGTVGARCVNVDLSGRAVSKEGACGP